MCKPCIALLALIGALAPPAAAGAQEPPREPPREQPREQTYVFDVAVNVSNLAPEVQAIGVSCSVCDAYDCGTRARNAVGGENAHYFPAGESRSFTGRIPVEVKKPTVWKPLGYICTLNIKLPEFDDFVPVELNADALPQAQPRPNTPFVPKLTGRLSGR
jgi:hypothetical protein